MYIIQSLNYTLREKHLKDIRDVLKIFRLNNTNTNVVEDERSDRTRRRDVSFRRALTWLHKLLRNSGAVNVPSDEDKRDAADERQQEDLE